jgi:pimeloyl-ACP methyl ester carboxylesterase
MYRFVAATVFFACITSSHASVPQAIRQATSVPTNRTVTNSSMTATTADISKPAGGGNITRQPGSSPNSTQSAGGSAQPVVEPRLCPFPVPEQAQVKATCWTVVVPLNRARPDGRTARLAVARLSSTLLSNKSSNSVPVAFINGGPGDPTLANVVPAFLSSPILAGRDMVLWDQRGTGASRPRLECPELTEAEVIVQLTAKSELLDAHTLMAASRACARRLVASGADLTAFTTVQSAADLEEIRRALGIPQWDLLGVSYGTALALETVRRYPDGVRRLVLDSVLPPDRARTGDVFTIYEQLTRLLTACQRDSACRKMLPDPQGALTRVVARYQADPHIVDFPANSETGAPKRRVVLTGNDIAGLFAQSAGTLVFPGGTDTATVLKSLPKRLAQLDTGDTHGLDELARLFRAPAGPAPLDSRFDQGMALAVMCHDRRALVSREEGLDIIRRTPRMARAVQTALFSLLYPDWASGNAPASFNTPVRSDIPTLVLAGEFDYQTPIDWSRHAAETLSQSRFVAFGTSGHALTVTACGQSVIASFLASPVAEPQTRCVPAVGSTRFDTTLRSD